MLNPAANPPRTATLICLTAVSTVSLNMFLPSLVNIAAEFQSDYATVSLAIAGYLAVTAVLQIVLGPLSDRFGRRPVLLAAMVIFAFASLGCALAPDVTSFLAFRFVQGAVIAGAALARVIVRDTAAPEIAAARLGHIAMVMALAPMLGPVLGGVLDQLFGWRASFAAFTGIGFALLALVWFDLGETNTARSATFGRQFRSYPALLGSGVFWGHSLCMALSVGAFFGFIAGVPLVASLVFDMSPAALGLCIGSITGGFLVGSFLASRLARAVSLDATVLGGRIVACAGLSVGAALFWGGAVSEAALFGSTVFVGIGNGITMPGASVGSMSVRADLAGTASGLSGALTVGCGAVVTWVAGMVVGGARPGLALLLLMLLCTFLSLLCALWAIRAGRRAGAATGSSF